jgi:hypothetical protein
MTSLAIHAALGVLTVVIFVRVNRISMRATGRVPPSLTNAILFPLWTMIDGPRRGLKGTWMDGARRPTSR